MIKNLRQHEEIMLYGNILELDDSELSEVVDFLKKEYSSETLSYPYIAPAYDEAAALWSAKVVYCAAQLMLYRESKEADLALLMPHFPGEMTPAAILTADLCLRFLPGMLTQLRLIDSEDPLIELLEDQLTRWHYSGINYPLNIEKLDFTYIVSDQCLYQLYVNRVIEHKKLSLAKHPSCKKLVLANLGGLAYEYWNDFKLATTLDE